jgi:hypothetical protein
MSTKKYLQMFNQPFFIDKENKVAPEVRKEIEWARETLKKEDWIIWYLRVYKLNKIKTENLNIKWKKGVKELYKDADLKKNNKFVAHMEKAGCDLGDYFIIEQLKQSLKHIVDLNLPKINAMSFGWKSPDNVLEEAQEHELSWQAKNKGDSAPEKGKKVVEFTDGSAWFDLGVSGCPEEADLMGHCGNGSHRPGSPQTILSYRKPVEGPDEDGEKRWMPYLTFILNKETGALGEMKGRGNSKPVERYHDAIIKLLKEDERIKKVEGGGYRAENNFHLSDLEKEKYVELIESKPVLFSMYQIYQHYGMVDKIGDFDFKELIEEALSSGGTFEHEGEKYYRLYNEMDLEDLAEQFDLKNLESYKNSIEQGYLYGYDGDMDWQSYNSGNVEEALSEWIMNEPELSKQLIAYLKNEYKDEIEENEWDINTASGMVSLAKEKGGMLDDVFSLAMSDGNEQGTLNEILEAFDAQINNFFSSEKISLLRSDEAHHSFNVGFTKKQFFDILNEHGDEFQTNCDEYEMIEMEAFEDVLDNNDINKAEDLNVPYYGFSDFDEEHMKECLKERLSEKVKEVCPALSKDLLHDVKSNKLPDSVLKKTAYQEINL